MRVFLSYSAADGAIARMVTEGLRQREIEVWPGEPISPGQDIAEAVAAGIREADAFVFLIGAPMTASRSSWASIEVAAALSSGKPIIPVLLDKEAELPRLLRSLRYVDATAGAVRENLAELLAGVLETTPDALAPTDKTALRDLLGGVSDDLLRERHAYEVSLESARRRAVLMQMIISAVALPAAVVLLIVLSADNHPTTAALLGGVAAGVAARAGYWFGRSERRASREHRASPERRAPQ